MQQRRLVRKGCHRSSRDTDDGDNGDFGNSRSQPKTIHVYFRELSEKRASVREEALSQILNSLVDNIEQDFVEKNFVTLVYHCLHCIKKSRSAKEMEQAAYTIGLLAMITDSVDKSHEAYEDVLSAVSQGLKSKLDTTKVLECLAVVTFFGASNSDETERAMQLIWSFIHPESGSSMKMKHSPAVLTAAISAWSFLLTAIDGWRLSYKIWQGATSYFSNLLDSTDETVSAAACEALALIFETNCPEKFSNEAKDSHGSIHGGETSISIHSKKELDSIIKQLRSRLAETSDENVPTQDPITELNDVFSATLNYLEEGNCLNSYETICSQKLKLSTWSQIIQIKFMKHFLGKDGFLKHMMRNKNFHDVFEFMLETRNSSGSTLYVPEREDVKVRFFRRPVPIQEDCSLLPFLSREDRQLLKKMTMSSNSSLSKATTQLLKKNRMLSSQERENDFFGVADE